VNASILISVQLKKEVFGGAKFWALIVDDYSDYCWRFLSKNKSDLRSKDQDFID
jgi:hypothetical protein